MQKKEWGESAGRSQDYGSLEFCLTEEAFVAGGNVGSRFTVEMIRVGRVEAGPAPHPILQVDEWSLLRQDSLLAGEPLTLLKKGVTAEAKNKSDIFISLSNGFIVWLSKSDKLLFSRSFFAKSLKTLKSRSQTITKAA
jgi:hypothetical protein